MKHPNAFAAFVTANIAAGVLWLAHKIHYGNLTAEQAVMLAGYIIAAVLFAGRELLAKGLVGVAHIVWRGSRTVAVGTRDRQPPAKH